MIFTGRNLAMIRRGVSYALDEIHNQIATCPNVFEYAEDLEELEKEQVRFNRLLARIDKALDKETEK